MIFAKNRDRIYKYCLNKGIEVKIHYPKPMYLQKSVNFLKHKKHFPINQLCIKEIISFP